MRNKNPQPIKLIGLAQGENPESSWEATLIARCLAPGGGWGRRITFPLSPNDLSSWQNLCAAIARVSNGDWFPQKPSPKEAARIFPVGDLDGLLSDLGIDNDAVPAEVVRQSVGFAKDLKPASIIARSAAGESAWALVDLGNGEREVIELGSDDELDSVLERRGYAIANTDTIPPVSAASFAKAKDEPKRVRLISITTASDKNSMSSSTVRANWVALVSEMNGKRHSVPLEPSAVESWENCETFLRAAGFVVDRPTRTTIYDLPDGIVRSLTNSEYPLPGNDPKAKTVSTQDVNRFFLQTGYADPSLSAIKGKQGPTNWGSTIFSNSEQVETLDAKIQKSAENLASIGKRIRALANRPKTTADFGSPDWVRALVGQQSESPPKLSPERQAELLAMTNLGRACMASV